MVTMPAFVSESEDFGATAVGTDLEVTLPAGYAAGHAVAIMVMANDETHTITPPAGFVLVSTAFYGAPNGWQKLFRKAMLGTEGASVHFTVTADENFKWAAVAYSGAAPATYRVATNSSGLTPMDTWSTPSYSSVVQEIAVGFIKAFSGYDLDPSSTLRSSTLSSDIVVVERIVGPGLTAGSTMEMSVEITCGTALGMRPLNSAPYAPTLTTLTGGQVIDVAITNRASHTFDDPDFDLPRPEGQKKYEIRYRVVGAPSWTTLTPADTTNQYHDFAGGTFTTGLNYERQVRTYDLAGEVGPWSGSSFFTGGTAPAAPVITDPTLDETITANSSPAAWTGTQTGYQIRTVGDSNGAPDTNVIYYDPGPILVSADHATTVPFLTNNRTEHVQVRVWNGTLWSAWASVRVHVAYTPPPAPVVQLSANANGGLVIDYATPAPTGPQPTPTYVDIWIDDGGDFVNERKATGLPTTGSWTYEDPRGGRDYRLFVTVLSSTADGIPSPSVGVLTLILDSATRGLLDTNVLA